MNNIYINKDIKLAQFIDLYRRSKINRPIDDKKRMESMLRNANLIVSAWSDDKLIGLARCFVDYGWVCYLSDLLVDVAYQKSGIGKNILSRVREEIKPHCQLVLLSAPDAMSYYPKVDFEKANHGFFIRRENV